MKRNRKGGHHGIIRILLDSIQLNSDKNEFVCSACGLLSNIARTVTGNKSIVEAGGSIILHLLLKSSKSLEVTRSTISALYNLASNNDRVKEDLAKAGCVGTTIEAVNAFRDPMLFTSSFGLLRELASSVGAIFQETIDSVAATLGTDAIYGRPGRPELHAFAKRVLESMESYPKEEQLQANGCHVLMAIPQTRAVKSLFRSGLGKRVLAAAGETFPDSCECIARGLLKVNIP